jgi:hypothetical protein
MEPRGSLPHSEEPETNNMEFFSVVCTTFMSPYLLFLLMVISPRSQCLRLYRVEWSDNYQMNGKGFGRNRVFLNLI